MKIRAPIERVQTGIRIEKRILKVLKAVAEDHDMTLGDLLEAVVLHALEEARQGPFSRTSIAKIAKFKELYGLDLTAADSHTLKER